jgi:hypothetical protein
MDGAAEGASWFADGEASQVETIRSVASAATTACALGRREHSHGDCQSQTATSSQHDVGFAGALQQVLPGAEDETAQMPSSMSKQQHAAMSGSGAAKTKRAARPTAGYALLI